MEFANYTNLKNSPLITSEISEGDMKHKFTNAHYTGLHIDHRRGYVLMGGGIVHMGELPQEQETHNLGHLTLIFKWP